MSEPTIAELLSTSRQAHSRYRTLSLAHGRDDRAMTAAIQEAADTLDAAHAADAEHADPAWSAYNASMHGVRVADLRAFYRRYLTPAEVVV